MVNRVTVPNFSQYNFVIGDTTEVVTKQNGVNASLQQFGNSLNTSIDQFNDDVEFVDTARQELDTDNIVHAPGSGLPNEAGTAYSRDMGTAGSQIRTNQQNDGRYYTQGQVDSLLAARLPAGMITMWSGSISTVPAGWALCNGSNGTPDLRNRFVVGAGSTYSVGDTGGSNSVTLTTAQMPSHNHGGSVGSGGQHNHGGSTGNSSPSTNSSGSHSHSGSTNSTGSHAHNIERHGQAGSGSVTRLNSDSISNDNSSQGSWSSFSTALRTASAGSHSHSLSINSGGSHSHTVNSHSHSISNSGTHTHSLTINSTGGGNSHENRPPYFAIAYIMKL